MILSLFTDENVANASVTVTWAQFSNSLMDFFMRATRQDLTDCSLQDPATSALFPNPQRELSNDDLAYIHERKFGGRPALRPAEFSEFWTWFGALSHQYRHNQVKYFRNVSVSIILTSFSIFLTSLLLSFLFLLLRLCAACF